MAEFVEMAQGEPGSVFFIEDDVGHAGQFRVPGHQDCREWQRCIEMGVDCKDAVDAPGAQKIGIGLDQIFFVPVVDGLKFRYAASILRLVGRVSCG